MKLANSLEVRMLTTGPRDQVIVTFSSGGDAISPKQMVDAMLEYITIFQTELEAHNGADAGDSDTGEAVESAIPAPTPV